MPTRTSSRRCRSSSTATTTSHLWRSGGRRPPLLCNKVKISIRECCASTCNGSAAPDPFGCPLVKNCTVRLEPAQQRRQSEKPSNHKKTVHRRLPSRDTSMRSQTFSNASVKRLPRAFDAATCGPPISGGRTGARSCTRRFPSFWPEGARQADRVLGGRLTPIPARNQG